MEILEQNLDDFFNLNPYLGEIYSNCTTTTTTTNYQSSAHGGAAAADQVVLSSWNGQEMMSPESSTMAAAAAAVETHPQIICFENKEIRYKEEDDCNGGLTLAPKIINFSASAAAEDDEFGNRDTAAATRTPSQAQGHRMSERKRRENIRQLFIALSKAVPGLRKLDKASLLEDAINHLKSLQERVAALEREEEMMMMMMNTNTNDLRVVGPPAEISVRSEESDVLIKICCRKEMDLISRLPLEIEKIHLHVTDIRFMPFGSAAFDITILAQMKSEFVGTVKDIVNHLQAVLGTAPTQI